jgi:hypothetical protein
MEDTPMARTPDGNDDFVDELNIIEFYGTIGVFILMTGLAGRKLFPEDGTLIGSLAGLAILLLINPIRRRLIRDFIGVVMLALFLAAFNWFVSWVTS